MHLATAADTGITEVHIIGVVGDSRFRSVRTPIDPIMFRNVNKGPGWMIVRYQGDPATVRSAVEREWKQITSEVPFNAEFTDVRPAQRRGRLGRGPRIKTESERRA